VEVAMANTSMEDVPRMQPRLLRGLTADTTNDWVTMGFPDLPQTPGMKTGCGCGEIPGVVVIDLPGLVNIQKAIENCHL